MSNTIEVPEIITGEVAVTEGGQVVLETDEGYPHYRTYTMPHPTDARDRIHYLSSYNLRYDSATSTWTKDVADKAGFHLAMESEWQDTIELNLDHTLRTDDVIRRIMGMMCNMDTGRTHWTWMTELEKDAGLRLGVSQPTTAEWRGESGDTAVAFAAHNEHPGGAAYVAVHNSNGLAGQIQAPGYQTPHSFAGLPLADSFLVLGKPGRIVVGTEAAAPLDFVTASQHRGGIRGDGAWVQVRDGQEHVIPHDAVPWSTLLPPLRAGCAYHSQFISTRGKAAIDADTATAAPFAVARATSFDQVSIEVTTGVAGATLRLGVYADDGQGRPGVLVRDAGTVDASTTGLRTIAGTFALQPGLYWLVAAARGGSPSVRTGEGAVGWMVPQPPTGTDTHNGYVGTHAADALAPTFACTGTIPSAPLVLLRAA